MGNTEKGVNQEERSDKLYNVYKWYPLAWEPDPSRSDSGYSIVAWVCFGVGMEESEGEWMGSDRVGDGKGRKRGHTMTSPLSYATMSQSGIASP